MSFIVAFSRGHAPVLTRFLVGASLSSLSLLLLSCGGGRGEGASPVGVVVAPVALAASPGISLLAGGLGGSGNVDGTGTAGRLSSPLGIVVDSTGNLYVADTSNQLVRKVTPAGVMTTLAGAAGKAGSVDGLASTARFNSQDYTCGQCYYRGGGCRQRRLC